ncbi:MAG: 4Fe-4S dicluster domain-containing protein [Lachnospiraceae bacterium]|nr:4Fe-4S dicluster domain-containing protein [Lachnospiraceae bacterium]
MNSKKLGFGMMRLPLTNPDDVKSIDYEQLCQMVDHFMNQGFVYFDTAYPYHGEQSEGAAKRCLVDRYPREQYILVDKMPILRVKAAEEYPRYFEEQLRRCGVEYFDYYLLHNMGKERYANTLNYGGFEFLIRLKEQKLVKNIGFSYHDDAELLDEILTKYPEMDFVQLQINYLDWNSAAIQSGACYEVACRHGKPIIAMEPVKGGSLANLPAEAINEMRKSGAKGSPASYAIRYAASLDNCMMVLSGMSTLEQVLDNTSYMKDFHPLNKEEHEMLQRITDIVNRNMTPCTNCRYCMEECPKNINIPAYFGLYNMYAATGKKTNMYYERYSMNHGKALDCVKCGKCERICPQHIEIRGELEKFADIYERN